MNQVNSVPYIYSGYNCCNKTSQTDANGNTTNYEYDKLNRLTKVTDPLGKITQYTYDANGNMTKMKDANNNETDYTYDAANQLTKVEYPAISGVRPTYTYTYDANGNKTSETDANGHTTNYTYDALNRLTSDGSVSYTYDAAGRKTQMTDGIGTTIYDYNAINRLTKVTYPDGRKVSYQYDGVGNLTKMTDAAGGETNYTYNAVNFPTQLVNPDSETTSYEYDALGRRTKITNANTTTANFSYNSMSRLTKLENKKSDSSVISSYEYSYDYAGNRTQMIEANGDKSTWEYDARNELTLDKKIDSGLQTIYNNSYNYDNVGNRLTKTDKDSNVTNYTYNSNNRLTQAGSTTYGYDDNGNQTSKTENSQTTNYSYNYENKLTTITYPSGDRSTYKYYGDGKRYEKQESTASAVIRYVYDGANILYEYDVSGSTIARYTMGLGIDEPIKIYVVADLVSAFYHFDGLGSVTKMTNSSQGVINSYTYDAWGEQISRTVTLPQPFTYTSREYDSTADLYFYRARWYDYKTGRFLARDPLEGGIIDPLSRNRYVYTRNNPVNRRDPTGLHSETACEVIAYAMWTVCTLGADAVYFACLSVCSQTSIVAIWCMAECTVIWSEMQGMCYDGLDSMLSCCPVVSECPHKHACD